MKNKKIYGYILTLITFAFFSLNGVGGRYLTADTGLDTTFVVFLRFLGGSIFLMLFIPFFVKKKDIKKMFIGKKSIIKDKIFWITAICLFGTIMFFMGGVKYSSATNVSLIQSLAPILVAIITLVIHPKTSHNYNYRKIFFVVMFASVGSSLLMSDSSFLNKLDGQNKILGDFLAFGSMICFAFFSFFNVELRRKYNKYNGLLITSSFLFVGALLSLYSVFSNFNTLFSLDLKGWIFLIIVSFGSTGIAYISLFFAGRYLNAVTIAFLFNIVGIITIFVENYFYGQGNSEISGKLYLGTFLIISSVIYINYLGKPKKSFDKSSKINKNNLIKGN